MIHTKELFEKRLAFVFCFSPLIYFKESSTHTDIQSRSGLLILRSRKNEHLFA